MASMSSSRQNDIRFTARWSVPARQEQRFPRRILLCEGHRGVAVTPETAAGEQGILGMNPQPAHRRIEKTTPRHGAQPEEPASRVAKKPNGPVLVLAKCS